MKVPLGGYSSHRRRCRTAKVSRGRAPRPSGITVHAQPSDEPAEQEINVIGCTVEEATRRVDKFLDDAALAGRPACASFMDTAPELFAAAWANFCPRIRWSKPFVPKPKIAAATPSRG